jgi:3-phenylpropionate/trans-cinnamate dioxygenase ferredoxin reductase subunit
MTTVLIIGAGQGGFQVAVSLREKGFDGRVLLLGDEPGLPYQRPPLSKSYLSGQATPTQLPLRPCSFFVRNGIELVQGRACALDRRYRLVRLADGGVLGYDHLVLATGARPRPLPVPGADLPGVLPLRTREDADALRARLPSAGDIVVIGAGFIGLEFAAVARRAGHRVTIVEASRRPMARVLTEPMSEFVAERHRWDGNTLLLDRSVAALRGTRAVAAVELDDGTRIPAELVVVGVGVVPNVEPAAAAGLAVGDGVEVDEHLVSSDPAISAIGDCASYPSRHAGGRVRLESVQNTVDHARCVASRLTGDVWPYRSVPWFWSEQFDVKLQIAGVRGGAERTVVSGDRACGKFSVLCFRGDRLVAVESVNRPGDHLAARNLLACGRGPTLETLRSADFALRKSS